MGDALAMTLLALAGLVTLAVSAWAVRWLWRERTPGVLVLLYHRVHSDDVVVTGSERLFSIARSRFVEHLDRLRDHGAQFLTLDALADCLNGAPIPRGATVITFDDGSASVAALAAPELGRRGLPATVFVTASPDSWVFDVEPRIADDRLRALDAEGTVRVGGHGMTHCGWRNLDPATLDWEVRGSLEALSAVVDRPVTDVAIPLNLYDRAAIDLCTEAGVRLGFSCIAGRARPGDARLELPRLLVEGTMTAEDLLRATEPRWLVVRRAIGRLKRAPALLLGEQRWMPLRARLFQTPLGRWLSWRNLRLSVMFGAALWLTTVVWLVAWSAT